jgi:sulfur-oxidizing protein SoxY
MEATSLLSRRGTLFGTLALMASAGPAAAQSSDDPWPSLGAQVFKGRPIHDGSALLAVDAPYRAEDAALVPLSIAFVPGGAAPIRAVTLLIDENPSPVAATFLISESSGLRSLSTRVRVDSYTNVHVVAEIDDGQLFAVHRFVKAAGGCSAPAAKQEAGSIPLGTMRFRQFPLRPGEETREVQLLIRHPNYSGMQMDQVSRLYVPARFVASVRVWQGNDLMLGVDSGISISENPEFRFDVRPNGAAEFRAEVTDSEGAIFQDSWPAARA